MLIYPPSSDLSKAFSVSFPIGWEIFFKEMSILKCLHSLWLLHLLWLRIKAKYTGKCRSEHSRRIQMHLTSSHAAALLPLMKNNFWIARVFFSHVNQYAPLAGLFKETFWMLKWLTISEVKLHKLCCGNRGCVYILV